MASVPDIESLMHSFNKSDNARDTVRTFEEIQRFITQRHDELNEKVKDDLVTIIKSHLTNESADVQKSALATWILLLRTFKHITDDFVRVVHSDSRKVGVEECVLPLYSFLIRENCLELDRILTNNADPNIRKEVLMSIFNASKDVPTDVTYKFILDKVVNSIFTDEDDDLRQRLIKFALFTKDKYPITSLQRDKQKEIGSSFKKSYLPVIERLRQENNLIWYELSIFIMNYCGKMLHSEIELTNGILRNIEAGFKTRTVDDRLKAYECWKVLIDNCSLDRNYLCSNKQLKLLVKPLKIKLSKQEQVMCKRFEVWSHFIEALQQKAIMYLTDFLDYSYGPLSPGKIESILPVGNEIIKTWPKRTDILMKFIGHYGHSQSCIGSDVFKFGKPIVTSTNFVDFDYLIINSVGVCCERLLQWDEKNSRISKVKCLWGSLFNIMKNIEEKYKEMVLRKVFVQIKHLLEKSLMQAEYFDDIVKHIFEVFVSFKQPICDVTVANQALIFPILEAVLPQGSLNTDRHACVLNLVKYGMVVDNKLFYFDKSCTLLKSCQHKKKECGLSLQVWSIFADVLIAICKTPRDSFQEFEVNAYFFMGWIVKYLFQHTSSDKIMDKWKSIIVEISAISSYFRETLLEEYETIIKECPELAVNVLDFLPIFAQLMLDEKANKSYVILLLSVTSECLKNPCIPKTKVVLIMPVMKKIIEVTSKYDIHDEVVLEKLFGCVVNILQPHQVFEIIPVLKSYFAKINEKVKQKVPNSLYKLLNELKTNSNVTVSKDAAFLISQLEKPGKETTNLFVQPTLSTRSARIASMATGSMSTSPKSSILRLFGQDVDAKSPVRLKGSQIGKVTPSARAMKIANAMPKNTKSNKSIEENKDKDFVLIDKEVKLDKSKMNEHQREMMRKRRDDIPALYQDLSQSQNSQSIDNSSCDTSQSKVDEVSNSMCEDNHNDVKKDILKNEINEEITSLHPLKLGGLETDKEELDQEKNAAPTEEASGNDLKGIEFEEILKIAMEKSKKLTTDSESASSLFPQASTSNDSTHLEQATTNLTITESTPVSSKLGCTKSGDGASSKRSDPVVGTTKSNLETEKQTFFATSAEEDSNKLYNIFCMPNFETNHEVSNIDKSERNFKVGAEISDSASVNVEFIKSDLFRVNQNMDLPSELAPSVSKVPDGSSCQMDTLKDKGNEVLSKRTVKKVDGIKKPDTSDDLDVFNFVSSATAEPRYRADSLPARRKRSVSYDSTKVHAANTSVSGMRTRKKGDSSNAETKLKVAGEVLEQPKSRRTRRTKSTDSEPKPSSIFTSELGEKDTSDRSSPESEAKKLKENFKIIPLTRDEESKNPEQIRLRVSISNDEDIPDVLTNECAILKQLDAEILKIDRNLKENSAFKDALITGENFAEAFEETVKENPDFVDGATFKGDSLEDIVKNIIEDRGTFENIIAPCESFEETVEKLISDTMTHVSKRVIVGDGLQKLPSESDQTSDPKEHTKSHETVGGSFDGKTYPKNDVIEEPIDVSATPDDVAEESVDVIKKSEESSDFTNTLVETKDTIMFKEPLEENGITQLQEVESTSTDAANLQAKNHSSLNVCGQSEDIFQSEIEIIVLEDSSDMETDMSKGSDNILPVKPAISSRIGKPGASDGSLNVVEIITIDCDAEPKDSTSEKQYQDDKNAIEGNAKGEKCTRYFILDTVTDRNEAVAKQLDSSAEDVAKTRQKSVSATRYKNDLAETHVSGFSDARNKSAPEETLLVEMSKVDTKLLPETEEHDDTSPTIPRLRSRMKRGLMSLQMDLGLFGQRRSKRLESPKTPKIEQNLSTTVTRNKASSESSTDDIQQLDQVKLNESLKTSKESVSELKQETMDGSVAVDASDHNGHKTGTKIKHDNEKTALKKAKSQLFTETHIQESIKKRTVNKSLDKEIQQKINKFLDSMTIEGNDNKKSLGAVEVESAGTTFDWESESDSERRSSKRRRSIRHFGRSPVTRNFKSPNFEYDEIRDTHRRGVKRVQSYAEERLRIKTRGKEEYESKAKSALEKLEDSIESVVKNASGDDRSGAYSDGSEMKTRHSKQRENVCPVEESNEEMVSSHRKRSRLNLRKTEEIGVIPSASVEFEEFEDIIESSQGTSVMYDSILKKSHQKRKKKKRAGRFGETRKKLFKNERDQFNSESKEVVDAVCNWESGEGASASSVAERFEEDSLDGENDGSGSKMRQRKSPRLGKPKTLYPKEISKSTLRYFESGDASTSKCEDKEFASLGEGKIDDDFEAHLAETAAVKDTETCDPNENIDIDHLIKSHEIPKHSALIGNMNIDSLPIGFETPRKQNLPCSPVCADTPVRNSEFLINTSDISPIRTGDGEALDAAISDNIHVKTFDSALTNPTEKLERLAASDFSYIKQPSTRSAKLLNLLPNASPLLKPTKSVITSVQKSGMVRISSPSTERIRKMMMNCGEKVKPPSFDNESDTEIMESDVLVFMKDVPSPFATPNSSILKRKASEVIEEGLSPHPKRKRVNFSDPPTTCQKIFFKEEDEYKMNFKKSFKKLPFKTQAKFLAEEDKSDGSADTSFSLISGLNLMKAEPIYPQLTSCNEDIKEITTILKKDELLEQFHSVNVLTVGDLAKLNDSQINQLEFIEDPKMIKIMDALEVFYSSYQEEGADDVQETSAFKEGLNCIFPDLVDCKDSILNILKLFVTIKTAREFKKKGIATVGDLARLSKIEISDLNIQIPKVSHVVNALAKYNRKLKREQMKVGDENYTGVIVENDDLQTLSEFILSNEIYQDDDTEDIYDTPKIRISTSDAEVQTCAEEFSSIVAAANDQGEAVVNEKGQLSEPSTGDSSLEHSLEKLSQNDLVDYIRNKYSSDEIKVICDSLLPVSE